MNPQFAFGLSVASAILITCLMTRSILFVLQMIAGRNYASAVLTFALSAGLCLIPALGFNQLVGFLISYLPFLVLWLVFDVVRSGNRNRKLIFYPSRDTDRFPPVATVFKLSQAKLDRFYS